MMNICLNFIFNTKYFLLRCNFSSHHVTLYNLPFPFLCPTFPSLSLVSFLSTRPSPHISLPLHRFFSLSHSVYPYLPLCPLLPFSLPSLQVSSPLHLPFSFHMSLDPSLLPAPPHPFFFQNLHINAHTGPDGDVNHISNINYRHCATILA